MSRFTKITPKYAKLWYATVISVGLGGFLWCGGVGVGEVSAAASTLTISVTDSVSLNLVPISTNGTFATSDTTTPNISVTTNHGTGYTLGIKASSENSTALTGTGSGGTIASISSSLSTGVSETNYKDDTYASTNNLNNTWGYRPSKLNSSTNNNYLPAPTSASNITTLDKTSVANPSTANTYNIAIGSRVTTNVVPDTYQNTFVFTVVANPSIYSITYNQNTTDTVSGMPTNVVNQETSGTTVTLSSNTPTRTGYNFLGWCTAQVADGAACTGTSYAPSSSWTIDQTASTNSLSIYAMWESAAPGNCTSAATCMQTMTSCPTTATDVTDARDGKTYKVQQLADGKCWMLDNLALDPTQLTQAQLYGSDSQRFTNASNTTLGYLKGATTGTTSDKYATAAVSYWTSSYSYSAPLIAIKNASNTNWNPDTVPSNSTLGVGSRKIGVYYNYCAASAGSYCYGNGTSAGTSSGNATESLCPYGWRMPTGNTSGEFNTLYTNSNYNTYTKYKTALSLPLSGYFYSGSANSQGSRGYWWSSTRYSNNRMYDLYLNTSNVYPTYGNDRYYGSSLRCVLGS